jgi:hypothetical protein
MEGKGFGTHDGKQCWGWFGRAGEKGLPIEFDGRERSDIEIRMWARKEPDPAKIFLLLTLGSDGDALWRGEERTAGKGLAFGGMSCLRDIISRVGCRYLSEKNLWMARPLLLALVPTGDLDV